MFVYALVDPRNSLPFYIGITVDLYLRFRQHMQCDGTNLLKDQRIQELLIAGHLPIMRTIERPGSLEHGLQREAYWIQHYLQQGVKLSNIAGAAALPAGTKPEYDIELSKYHFRTSSGKVVSALEASHEEFDAFIRGQVSLDGKENWWPLYLRRGVINYMFEYGIQPEFCEPGSEAQSSQPGCFRSR